MIAYIENFFKSTNYGITKFSKATQYVVNI